jgi:tetratricopeptide (TPR) repeat protein
MTWTLRLRGWSVRLGLLALLCAPGCTPDGRLAPPERPPVRLAAAARHGSAEAYHLLLRAELALGQGRLDGARSALRAALVEDPDSIYLRLRLARLLEEQGEITAALLLVRAAVSLAPRDPQALLLLAELVAPRQPDEALVLARRAGAARPQDPRPALLEARLQAARGDAAAEQAAYRRVLRHRPDHLEGLLGLSRARARAGDRGGAAELARRATRAQPVVPGAHLEWARLLLALGRPAEAEQVLEEALEATGDDPDVVVELFRLRRLRNRPDRVADLLTLLARHETPAAVTLLAQLRDTQGEEDQARALVRRARDLDPRDPTAVLLDARLGYRRGGLAPVRALVAGLPEDREAQAAAQALLAELLEAEGQTEAAERLLRQARRDRPNDHNIMESLAFHLARTGRLGEAESELGAALRASRRPPSSVASRYTRGLLLHAAGKLGEVVTLARGLVRERPDDAAVANLLGYVLADAGVGLDEALRVLGRAAVREPLNPSLLDSLGWALRMKGRLDEAVQVLRRTVLLDPRLTEAWIHLGLTLEAADRWSEAREAYARGLALRPARSRRAVLLGRRKRLEEVFSSRLRRSPVHGR